MMVLGLLVLMVLMYCVTPTSMIYFLDMYYVGYYGF